MKQDSTFDMQEEEYALSKDIDVALWIDYRTFYGECPLKELLGGNFVIVNEHLQEEFEEFRGKIQCTIGTTHILVKGIELLKLWLKSINAYLKSVAVLGSTYFLMSSSDLDDVCQWVTDKRSYFCGKQFTVDGLFERTEQCAGLSYQIAEEQHINMISYIPVCNIWQKETCASLGLTLIHGNYSHVQQPIMINVSHRPATTRIAANGNFYITCCNRISRLSSRTASSYNCTINLRIPLLYPLIKVWNST